VWERRSHAFPPDYTNWCDSTRASRLLHKCHENLTICVLKLVIGDCCLVSINVATGVSLINIRLLPISTPDNFKCLRYSFIIAKYFINKPDKARLPSLNPKQSETSPINGVVYNSRKLLFETITKHTLG